MKKIEKMRLCDRLLILLTVVTLASSIQLEASPGTGAWWIVAHIVMATIFLVLIGWHLYLHFQWRNWFSALKKQKSPVTRWLAVFYVLTALSAIIAAIHWIGTLHHSPIGGVHGKIGFVFILLVIGHTLKRIKSPVLK